MKPSWPTLLLALLLGARARRRDAPPRPTCDACATATPRALRSRRAAERAYEMAVLSSLAYVDWPAFASPRASPAAAAPPGPGGANRTASRRAPCARPSAPLVVDFSAAVQAPFAARRLRHAAERAARRAAPCALHSARDEAARRFAQLRRELGELRARNATKAPPLKRGAAAPRGAAAAEAAPGFRRWALQWWLHDWWEPGAAGMRWHDTRVLLAEEQPCEVK